MPWGDERVAREGSGGSSGCIHPLLVLPEGATPTGGGQAARV